MASRGTTNYRWLRSTAAATLTAFAAATVAAAVVSSPGILRNALVALWLGVVTGVAAVVVRSSGDRQEWLVRARYIGGVAVAVLIVAVILSNAEFREGGPGFYGETEFRPAACLLLIGLAILCLGLLGPAAEGVMRRASKNGTAAVLLSLPVVLLAFLSVAVASVAQVDSLGDTPFGYAFRFLAVAVVAGSCVGAVRSSGALLTTRPVAVLGMVLLAGLAVTWPFAPDVLASALAHLFSYGGGWPLSLWDVLGVVVLGTVPSFVLAMRAAAPASSPLARPRARPIIAWTVGSTFLIIISAIPGNYSAEPFPLRIVTVPYSARVELLNDQWVVSEQITIDDDAREQLQRRPAVDRLREQEVERKMAAEGWPLAKFVDGDPVFVRSGQRSIPTRLPSLSSTTDVIGLTNVHLGAYVMLTPRAHSVVEIEAPTALIVETFPPISSRADVLIRRAEQIRVELVADGTSEIRLAMVAWVLRSKPGHWVYAATRWPLLPYALGLVVVFALGLLRDRLTERVMAIAGRRAEPRRRKRPGKPGKPARRGKRR